MDITEEFLLSQNNFLFNLWSWPQCLAVSKVFQVVLLYLHVLAKDCFLVHRVSKKFLGEWLYFWKKVNRAKHVYSKYL